MRRFTLLSCALAAAATHAQEATTDDIITAPGLEEKKYIGPLEDAYDRIDPLKDGWQTEAISADATAQLKELAHLLEDPAALDAAKLAPLAAKDYESLPLYSAELADTFKDSALHVRRMAAPVREGTKKHRGPAGLAEALREWFAAAGIPGKEAHPHAKVKLFRIEARDAGTATSKVLCTVTAEDGKTRTQINATWTCEWTALPGTRPLLKSIAIDAYEEVTTKGAEPLLADATASILGSTTAYQQQFLRTTDHWRKRIPRDFGLDVVANHGLAIGDINGDGLEDLYVCQQGGLPNRLFLQNPDGSLRDFTAESNTGWLDYCASALIVDLDNDGDKDLVISQDFKILFMDNLDGQGRFELAFGESTKAQSFTLAAADFDEDGFLDVYVCGYNPSAAESRAGAMGEPMPFHDANNGGANTLWRNLGNWEFQDVTTAVGLDVNNRRFSFAASWEDFDNDGDLDLYVANDYGRNCLYRNEGRGAKFTDIAAKLQLEDTSAGMSTHWADFNRDGWMDLYLSNMFSSAGNRITFQRQFMEGTPDDVRQHFQHMARGNTLFQSDGKGGFTDASVDLGVTMGRWAWGSGFVDLNNDGWDDILVANGFITTDDTGDL